MGKRVHGIKHGGCDSLGEGGEPKHPHEGAYEYKHLHFKQAGGDLNCSAFVTRTRICLDVLPGIFHLRQNGVFFYGPPPVEIPFPPLPRGPLSGGTMASAGPSLSGGQTDRRELSDSSHFQTANYFHLKDVNLLCCDRRPARISPTGNLEHSSEFTERSGNISQRLQETVEAPS